MFEKGCHRAVSLMGTTMPRNGWERSRTAPERQGERADRAAGRATDLQARPDERELVDACLRELLEVHDLHDGDPGLRQEEPVDGLPVVRVGRGMALEADVVRADEHGA